MAVNPDQLWTTLDKIEQKLLSIVDDFDAVSQAAVSLNGDIAKVLPVQLNASADAVLDLVNGAGQNSIKNLKDYVDNIPLGDLRTKSSAEAIFRAFQISSSDNFLLSFILSFILLAKINGS